jgi:TolA-binding protein
MKWQIYKSRGDFAEAERTLKDYNNTYPDDIKARLELLKLYFVQNKYDNILTESRSFEEEYPGLEYTNPYAFFLVSYLKGLSLISGKSYGEALTVLSRITKQGTRDTGLEIIFPYSYYYKAWALYRLGLYTEAVSAFSGFKSEYPEHEMTPMSVYLIGWCYYTQGEYSKALVQFSELAEQSVSSEKIDTTGLTDKSVFLAAKCYQNIGNISEAKTLLSQISRTSSGFADDALFDYSVILSEEKNMKDAINALNEFKNKYPDSPLLESVYYKTGELYFAGGSYNEAVDEFYDYRQHYPEGQFTDASLYWSGLASSMLGENLNTLLVWEMLIMDYKKSPYYIDTVQKTAEIYISYKDYSKALSIYTGLLELYPEEARTYGIDQKATELKYLISGLSDKEAELKAVIERNNRTGNKTGREAMIELARLYLNEQEKFEQAYNLLTEVTAYTDDKETHADAQYLTGEYYFKNNEYISAGNEFLKAAVINPADRDLIASSLFRAAEMMKYAGMSSDVRALVKRLEDNFPNSQWTVEAQKLLEELR